MRKLVSFTLVLLMVLTTVPVRGQGEIYKDPTRSVTERVNDLLPRLTLEEKVGQMTLVEKDSINTDDIAPLGIGGLLSGGGGSPKTGNNAKNWAAMVDGFQKAALQSRLGIPMIYGVDAVHGHNNLYGTVIFPHNIGLGAANDPDLVKRIAQSTAQTMIATGIYWNYAPVVAVAQDIRWGRTYESYSENTALVSKLSSAFIVGSQGAKLSDPGSVLATAKHYVGDGGTKYGTPTTSGYLLDTGITDVDEQTLRAVHLPPYIEAIKSGARNIMVSFSSWGGSRMSAQRYLLTDVLKGELGFSGFLVSDWGAIEGLPGTYNDQVKASINAGLDMIMVPYTYQKFITTLLAEIKNGDIPMARIDDAVKRILTVKFEMGLFEHPYSDPTKLDAIGGAADRALGREAVNKSAVLLQNNNNVLPLAKDVTSIYIAGSGADDIGMQTGGWTIEWQGRAGKLTPGTSVLTALKGVVSSKTTVKYDMRGKFDGMADVGIAVVGEQPYAEGRGDATDLGLPVGDLAAVNNLREHCKTLIVVLLSGRPMIIGSTLNKSDAFVAAWLPGTEGEGIVDLLFGDKPFSGKLSFTWPRTMKQLPFNFKALPTTGCDAPLFAFGYGLDTSSKVTVKDECTK